MSEVPTDNLSAVLDAFRPALKSVDVRTVAIKPPTPNDAWTNLLTFIFVSEKTVDQIEVEHKGMPKVRNDRFGVFLKAGPLPNAIFDEILNGVITFNDSHESVTIACRHAQLLGLKVYPTPRTIRGISKFVLACTDVDPHPDRGSLWSVVSNQNLEAKRAHYQDATALIRDVIDTDYVNIGDARDFDVAVSTGITIGKVAFDGSSFKVTVRGVSEVKDLQLNFALGRSNYYVPVWRGEASLKEGNPSKDGGAVEAEIEVPDVKPFDQMLVELIHRNVPLTISSAVIQAPLENAVEPFLCTLNAFCTFDDFKRMLFEPQHYAKPPEKIFENAVAWLLSLAGFYTINLSPAKVKSLLMYFVRLKLGLRLVVPILLPMKKIKDYCWLTVTLVLSTTAKLRGS